MTIKGNAPMPACNIKDQNKVLDGLYSLRGKQLIQAEQLLDSIGSKQLCTVLHAMRRWYSYNTWNAAKKILPYRAELSSGMTLQPPLGVYRGFKVDRSSELLEGLEEGDVITLPVKRNGGCSSWTATEHIANRFSGSSKGKVGIVIRLVSGTGVKTFIAPPSKSQPWFNKLYEATMGKSFRLKEEEYAIFAPRVRVEIVRIKRK